MLLPPTLTAARESSPSLSGHTRKVGEVTPDPARPPEPLPKPREAQHGRTGGRGPLSGPEADPRPPTGARGLEETDAAGGAERHTKTQAPGALQRDHAGAASPTAPGCPEAPPETPKAPPPPAVCPELAHGHPGPQGRPSEPSHGPGPPRSPAAEGHTLPGCPR